MEGTLWAFLPAVIAIILALVTKQVYISLFFGIFVGAMMYAGGDILKAMFTLFQVMSEKVGGIHRSSYSSLCLEFSSF